ncbi:flagellar filament capping protein FliD [Cytobacillus dafuensis]|uniref:Flagellar hook-associated protein 2 n=1 Tax=Cytobacillus dafuensis TaxID=1742359 RepID=A0A5B8ZBG1_CYTDA|nr:flagellar filament capping protein FliD [Cytobacillus dafuensis]QED49593.1 flagellar hook protein [Cytobacillus dafuensis]
MRISGIASGMDIDQMVKDLMKAERAPLDKMKQQKQTLQWQRDDYRSLNTLMLDFRSTLTQMKLTSNYRARQTSSTDESKLTAIASGSAGKSSYSISNVTQLASAETQVNGGNIAGIGKTFDSSKGIFGQKESMAQSGTDVWKQGVVESKTISNPSSGATITTGLTNIDDTTIDSWSVKVSGKSYKVITGGTPGDNEVLVDSNGNLTFNKEIAQGTSIRIDYVAKEKTDSFKLQYNSSQVQISRGSINNVSSILIKDGNGTTIDNLTIQGNPNDLTREIKNSSGDVVGTLNSETGKITFTDKMPLPAEDVTDPGDLRNFEITYDQNYTTFSMDTHTSKGQKHESFLIQGNESLNSVIGKVNGSSVGVTMFYDSNTGQASLTRAETGDFNTGAGREISTSGSFINDVLKFGTATVTGGQNAKFEINGLETERSSNTFEMNGVTFTIKQKFTDAVSVNVSNDSSKVAENIKEFVKKYNELVDKIQSKLSEDRNRTYLPLTDEQREEMSEKQQELWDEKAKSGLLRHDPILSSVLSEMRLDFYQPVQNSNVADAYNQLAKIGITTSKDYLKGGKLEINEAKLLKAIEEDPESVENLFRGEGTTESEKGIVHRLYDSVSVSMDKLKEKAGNSTTNSQQYALGRQLDNVDKRIDRFEDRLKDVEARYWRQFTAMEKAIQQANSQSAYLMQQFGGGM